MRSSQSFVVALLAGVFGLLPMSAAAQNKAILLMLSSDPLKPTVLVVQCKDVKTVSGCTIIPADQSTCTPGKCDFHQKPQADYPGVAIFGQSGNATCAWVFVYGRYYYYC
jgi:hypothetical protein